MGFTALHYAAMASNDNSAIVKLLLDKGANPKSNSKVKLYNRFIVKVPLHRKQEVVNIIHTLCSYPFFFLQYF